MGLVVERCTSEDAEAVSALARQAALDVDVAAELERPQALLLVAREHAGGTPCAFLLAWHVADEIELLDLATHPELRRRGLARALVHDLCARARAARATAIYLEVRPSNAPALALYEAAGFSAVGRRPRYYSDGEDALLLRRVVTEP